MSEEPGGAGNADDDVAFLVALRRGDAQAVRAFTRRFYLLLLDQARRLGVERAERDSVVTSFLDDMMMTLEKKRKPESLATFVVTSFRNHVTDAYRTAAVRDRLNVECAESAGGENVVKVTCSEYTLRATLGPGESVTDCGAAAQLMDRLLPHCTREERQLLIWTSHRVPMREIARWLGLGYDATRQRSSRLRARLARDAIALLPELDDDKRIAMTRLLTRIGVRCTNDNGTGGAAA